jgi:hypothetical protein
LGEHSSLLGHEQFDCHPYQLHANAGKGKTASLGFPDGVIQEQGEVILKAWSTIVSTFAEYQSILRPAMAVPTGNWGADWAASKAVEKASLGSQHLAVTEKYHRPMRLPLAGAKKSSFW